MTPEYKAFLKQKAITNIDAGFQAKEEFFPAEIFPHQSACVKYACKKGRAGLFLDTGLGKTITQLTWADQVMRETGGIVIVLAPLAVASQTEREGRKFGISVKQISSPSEMGKSGIYVTNYEKLHLFSDYLDLFDGVVLDESSILKGMDGKMRRLITESFSQTPYRLSCSATPSPNDFMELGTQAEFLGVMTQTEMLATFFIHDGGDTSKWRLKGHGRDKFFEWLASWSIFLTSPADLGFDGSGYELPPIHYHQHVIETTPENGLFVEPAQGLLERNQARRDTVEDRCKKAAEIVNGIDSPALVWCHLNDESQLLTSLINGSVEVTGADSLDHKINAMEWFCEYNDSLELTSNGKFREKPCLSQDTSKNIIKQTKRNESSKQKNGSNEMQTHDENTCRSTENKTLKNGNQPRKKEQGKMQPDEQNMHLTSSIEISKKKAPEIFNPETQKIDSIADSKNMGSMQINIEQYLNHKTEGVQYADVKIQDVQNKNDYTLTIATPPEELEGCFAQTATKESENLKTNQKDLGLPQVISKKVLVSKPKIFGYGMNLQNSHHCVFVGLSDSWESFYQAIRRQWRFGQKQEVHVHIVSADIEGAVVENIQRKDDQHKMLMENMMRIMRKHIEKEVFGARLDRAEYDPQIEIVLPDFIGRVA